ncbi:uncharacterized protein FIBRA_02843 [Fibroporia radiculosa]|uniref:Uncharacterized protein n=1 Tax=Fibroporia radiculosa TaxID=599839 RepID=J4I9A1_9APHY|nr:uncharacterized protein FIBRA_02843 [Fibroporia radiculosa]CCM00801.1 predicted protein [Fibroporia radiculosa]
MAYTSPLANPQTFIAKVNALSNEGITIDKGVARAKRDAADFASKYAANFQLVVELQASADKFSASWVSALQQTRNAASSVSAWLQRFVDVFLSMLDLVTQESDINDVIIEFNNFLAEAHPSSKYQLDNMPGVKTAFSEIEALVPGEIHHVIDALAKAKADDWSKIVEDLKKELAPVKVGTGNLRTALDSYATKLD